MTDRPPIPDSAPTTQDSELSGSTTSSSAPSAASALNPAEPLPTLAEADLRRAHERANAVLDACTDLADPTHRRHTLAAINALIRLAIHIRRPCGAGFQPASNLRATAGSATGYAAYPSSSPSAPTRRVAGADTPDPAPGPTPRAGPSPTQSSVPSPQSSPPAPPSSAAADPRQNSPNSTSSHRSSPPPSAPPATVPPLPASPPPAARHPCPTHGPETAVRAQLEALRQNDHPEPNSGAATVHAFMAADDRGTGIPWSRFARDFARLAGRLLGFTSYCTRQTDYKPVRPPDRPARSAGQIPFVPAPEGIPRAAVRVDLTYPGDRTASLLFHLAQLPVIGSLPTWFTREIEVLDSS